MDMKFIQEVVAKEGVDSLEYIGWENEVIIKVSSSYCMYCITWLINLCSFYQVCRYSKISKVDLNQSVTVAVRSKIRISSKINVVKVKKL